MVWKVDLQIAVHPSALRTGGSMDRDFPSQTFLGLQLSKLLQCLMISVLAAALVRFQLLFVVVGTARFEMLFDVALILYSRSEPR